MILSENFFDITLFFFLLQWRAIDALHSNLLPILWISIVIRRRIENKKNHGTSPTPLTRKLHRMHRSGRD